MAAFTKPALVIGLLLGLHTPVLAADGCAADGMTLAAGTNAIAAAVMATPTCAVPEAAKAELPAPTPEALDEPAIAKATDTQVPAIDPARLQELGSISDQIRATSDAIDQRQVVLEAAARRLDARMAELTAIRDGVARQFTPAPSYDKEHIASLAQLYTNMKPATAADQMAGLPPDMLMSIAEAMPARKLSAIVANLPAPQADALTGDLTAQMPETFAPGTLPTAN